MGMNMQVNVFFTLMRDSPVRDYLNECIDSDEPEFPVFPLHPFSKQPHPFANLIMQRVLPYIRRENINTFSLIIDTRFSETIMSFVEWIYNEVYCLHGEYDSDYRDDPTAIFSLSDLVNAVDQDV